MIDRSWPLVFCKFRKAENFAASVLTRTAPSAMMARVQQNSKASIAKSTGEILRLNNSVNIANQNNKSSWRCEIQHTYNSTQTHIQSTQCKWELCNCEQGSSTHRYTHTQMKSQFWEVLAWGLTVMAVCSSLNADLQSFYRTDRPRHLISGSASSACV